MTHPLKSICVCGAGTMGSGIAQITAQSGHMTIVFDLNEQVLQKAENTIHDNFQKLVEKNKLSKKAKDEILARIKFTDNLNDCKADLIIEAIIERLKEKVALFQQLLLINTSETIYASNTSSLSITTIANELDKKGQIVGLHFFNPAPLMKLVELVYTEYTNMELISLLKDFIKGLEKTIVICKDAPGFIVNRVARPYYIEALRLAEQGKYPLQTIDKVLEAQGFKMGPFKLMDLIGNDINYTVSCSVYEQLGKPPRLKPSYLQKEKVENGELGKKTGKGYYKY